jgi:fucose permease
MIIPRIENKSHKRLYWLLLLNFLMFGMTMTVLGSAVPMIIRTYKWDYMTTGILLACGPVGYFVSSFIVGQLLNRLGSKKILLTGLVIEILCLSFVMRSPSPVLNYFLFFCIGIGQGCVEVVTNYQVVLMEDDKNRGRLMNLMHAFFCIGAVIAPFIVGNFEKYSIDWQNIFIIAGLLIFIITVCMFFLSFIRPVVQESGLNKEKKKSLLNPLLLIFFILLFLYVGIEFATSNWISEYFVSVLKSSIQIGSYMVSVFWLGILAGRLFFSAINQDKGQEKILQTIIIFSGLSILLIILSNFIWLSIIAVFMIGLGYSAVYPIIMSLVGKIFKNPEVLGFISTGGGIGAFLFPFIIAFIGDRAGLRGGFVFLLAICFIMMVLSGIIMVWSRRVIKQS